MNSEKLIWNKNQSSDLWSVLNASNSWCGPRGSWRLARYGGRVANALFWQTIRPLMYLCTFCVVLWLFSICLGCSKHMTNIEQTLSIVCDIKLEIYLMPLDAFGEAEDCGPAFWQLCIHPVNILIDKYPKITLKYRTKILKICFYWKYVDSARPPPALFSDKGWCG